MKKRFFPLLLAFAFLFCMLGGCKSQNKKVIGSCAECDVLYEELRFVTLTLQNESPATSPAELKERVALQIAKNYAPLALAKIYAPELTLQSPEISDAVKDSIAEEIERQGSKKAYRAYLKENYLTENLAKQLLARAQLELKCREILQTEFFSGTYLETEATFATWLQNGNLVRLRRITAISEADARQICLKLQSGASAEQAIAGTNANLSERFYLVRGYTADSALETAAFALNAENKVGEVEQTDAGYSILIWEQNDYETFGNYQLPTYFRNMRAEQFEEKITALMTEIAKDHPFVFNESGESIDLAAIK